MTKKYKKAAFWQRPSLLLTAAAVFILIVVLIFMLRGRSTQQTVSAAGLDYLKSLESRDVSSIEKSIKEIEKEEQREALESGELTVWEQFQDYALVGDSRTMAFYQYGFLPSERILAHTGATINDIPDYMDRLKTLNPSYIFLCYGLNDVELGYWNSPEDYAEDLGKAIESIREELPDAEVFVNSIFPAHDPPFELSEGWRDIPEYNEVVKAYCEEKGYPYIDNTKIAEEHSDLYEDDGVHFLADFYEYWAVNMLTEV